MRFGPSYCRKGSLLTALVIVLSVTNSSAQIITTDGPLEFCVGESVTLCVEPPCVTYLWSTGSTVACIEVFESGSYYPICLDSQGNIDSTLIDSAVTVVVHDPQPTLYQLNGIIYLGEPWAAYQWFYNGDSIIYVPVF